MKCTPEPIRVSVPLLALFNKHVQTYTHPLESRAKWFLYYSFAIFHRTRRNWRVAYLFQSKHQVAFIWGVFVVVGVGVWSDNRYSKIGILQYQLRCAVLNNLHVNTIPQSDFGICCSQFLQHILTQWRSTLHLNKHLRKPEHRSLYIFRGANDKYGGIIKLFSSHLKHLRAKCLKLGAGEGHAYIIVWCLRETRH